MNTTMTADDATIDLTELYRHARGQRVQSFSGELYRFHGFKVVDSAGEAVGIVDWIWTNEITGQGDHIGLQLQWIRGRARGIPAAGAVIDHEQSTVRLPFSKQQIAGAPRFRIDRALLGRQRAKIAAHFTPSPLAAGSAALLKGFAA